MISGEAHSIAFDDVHQQLYVGRTGSVAVYDKTGNLENEFSGINGPVRGIWHEYNK